MAKCDENTVDVSIAIPTFYRGQILLETLRGLMRQSPCAREILVVDQTPEPQESLQSQLSELVENRRVRWLRRERPSVPAAMNQALQEARSRVVLFLDDDIIAQPGLVGAHAASYADEKIYAVAGQVLQPGQKAVRSLPSSRGGGIWKDLNFPFNAAKSTYVHNCMAGNFSVRRDFALRCGGFDERFVGVAYRFETEFTRRLIRNGGRVLFCPQASIFHLQSLQGGTRFFGDPLRSARPDHSVGDYYFALCETKGPERVGFVIHRMLRSVRTRFHLLHPWWIPLKLLGEVRGLVWAMTLHRKEPEYIRARGTDELRS